MKNKFKYILFTTLIVLGCSKQKNNAEISNGTNFSKPSTQNSILVNQHHQIELDYYSFLLELKDTIKQSQNRQVSINNMINNSQYNISLNVSATDLSIYQNFFTNIPFSYNNLVSFEQFVLINYQGSNYDNLYKSISFAKSSIRFHENYFDPGVFKQKFEDCLDGCIETNLDEIFMYGNWIDQAAFIAGIPGSFLTIVASCAWDCNHQPSGTGPAS